MENIFQLSIYKILHGERTLSDMSILEYIEGHMTQI